MSNEPLKLKHRTEDIYKVFSIRLKEETITALDRIAKENNYSLNKLINIGLEYGIENIQIEE